MRSFENWIRDALGSWNRFWFEPSDPHTLSLIRILGGGMLFYTHLVWSIDLLAFLGPDSWIPSEVSMRLQEGTYAWSHLWYIESPALLWAQHIFALIVFAMLTLGVFTRASSVLACLLAISYCHRLEGALFGLDQVNAMLAMYLMIGPCGAVYSIDHWLANRMAGEGREPPPPTVSCNVAIRLIQLHMCIIYLFGGISKMRGDMWWDGTAVWYAISNPEYQSFDMTWLVRYPWLIATLSHITVFWEAYYCALVWPRQTRPIALFLAVSVHGGIAMFLGMITFGLAMIFGNLAFVSPQTVDHIVGRLVRRPAKETIGAKIRTTRRKLKART